MSGPSEYQPPPSTEMGIDEFVRRMAENLERFRTHFATGQGADPEAWPDALPGHEWESCFFEWVGVA